MSRWIVSARQDLALDPRLGAGRRRAARGCFAAAPPIDPRAGLLPARAAGGRAVGRLLRRHARGRHLGALVLGARRGLARRSARRVVVGAPGASVRRSRSTTAAFGAFLVGAYALGLLPPRPPALGLRRALPAPRSGDAAGPAWLDQALLWTGAAAPVRCATRCRTGYAAERPAGPAAATAAARRAAAVARSRGSRSSRCCSRSRTVRWRARLACAPARSTC